MPTCSNIIHPIIHFRFPVTWEKKSLESAANSISERLNIKIFSGSMPLDPPRGLPLQRWLLTLTTQPSTSKLSDNPALETMTRPNQGLCLSRSIGMGRREPRERGWQVGNNYARNPRVCLPHPRIKRTVILKHVQVCCNHCKVANQASRPFHLHLLPFGIYSVQLYISS